LLTLENYGGYNNRFFLTVFRLAEFFPAAFRLMLKIFALVAKFGGLGVYDRQTDRQTDKYHKKLFRWFPLGVIPSKFF